MTGAADGASWLCPKTKALAGGASLAAGAAAVVVAAAGRPNMKVLGVAADAGARACVLLPNRLADGVDEELLVVLALPPMKKNGGLEASEAAEGLCSDYLRSCGSATTKTRPKATHVGFFFVCVCVKCS